VSTLRFGRRPAKNAPSLRLASLLSGTVPEHAPAANHLNLGGWAMLGNDTYGDCVAVTWANFRRLMSRLAGRESYPTMAQVVDLYETQNPGFPNQDDGMDIQTTLEHLLHNGGPDGVAPVAFAKVDHTNLDEVKSAIAIFGALWVGIDVTKANMIQFDSGEPWDHVRSVDEGGHSVIVGGYDSDGVGGDQTFVTWATETAFTDAFWTHQVEEAWVVIWPENLGTAQFEAGIDVGNLAVAYHDLTGRSLPPIPPSPAPTPAPVDVDAALVAAIDPWAVKIKSHSHVKGSAANAAAAYRTWKQAKGL
jgi:hypothetical protein